jgi:hypothetical protein
MYKPSGQFTLSAVDVVKHAQEGQPAQMSASVRARPIGNSVERYCITKCNQQIHRVELPTRLQKLDNAQVIAESTGGSLKYVYLLVQQDRIPHYRIEGTIRFNPECAKVVLLVD